VALGSSYEPENGKKMEKKLKTIKEISRHFEQPGTVGKR
jgi:hypothetical protein